jgi:hypothetical protein
LRFGSASRLEVGGGVLSSPFVAVGGEASLTTT